MAVIILPDMEQDEDAKEWADYASIQVVFGPDHIMERLLALAPTARCFTPNHRRDRRGSGPRQAQDGRSASCGADGTSGTPACHLSGGRGDHQHHR